MLPRRGRVAWASAILTGACAVPAGAATTGPQAHPHLSPRTARAHTRVTLRLTLPTAAGTASGLTADYRIQVDPPAGGGSTCRSAAPASVTSGAAGATVTRMLPRPHGGWCRGDYLVTVFLQRRPRCQSPVNGQAVLCPEYVIADANVGSARLHVLSPSRRAR